MALALCALLLSLPPVIGSPIDQQHVISSSQGNVAFHGSQSAHPPPPRKLRGRFLHITDLHPDPFYKDGSSKDESCHSGSGAAGLLGHAASDCDSPVSLINATFQWIDDTIRDDIDFIVWTGDSARHDNDENIPRTEEQVVSLNRLLVNKFEEVFGVDDTDPTSDFIIPIVPTFGNNDILPHNIFHEGPNKWTKRYSSIWDKFIPEEQRHTFERGGWFVTEVIPRKLAIFSLNTLYFFDSNSAVDGCARDSDPGYEHFEWLRAQLQILRGRGMKAIMTGHVPPARTESKQSWDESCWQKYTLFMRQYRDVVIGGLWGHMNMDHFIIQDSHDVDALRGRKGDSLRTADREPMLTIESSAHYLEELRQGWQRLPNPPSGMTYSATDREDPVVLNKDKKHKHKKPKEDKRQAFLEKIGGKWAERYSLSLVSPSIVPNYYPTMRIIEYNITGLEEGSVTPKIEDAPRIDCKSEVVDDPESAPQHITNLLLDDVAEVESKKGKHKKKKGKKDKKKKKKKPKFKIPDPPSSTSPPGPGYSPQSLSLLSYTQYFANITKINADIEAAAGADLAVNQKKKHRDALIRDHFKFEVEYDTKNYTSKFGLDDLTVRSYLHLAKKIAKKSKGESAGSRSMVGLPWEEHNSVFEDDEEISRTEHSTLVDSGDIEPSQQDIRAEAENLASTADAEGESTLVQEQSQSLSDHEVQSKTRDGGKSTSDLKSEAKKGKGSPKGKKGKHKSSKSKNKVKNDMWFTFIKRAFVESKSDEEIRETFGS